MVDIIRQIALDHDVAGEKFAFRIDLTAAANFDDLFGRNQNFLEFMFEVTLRRLITQRLRDFVLEIRIGVNDIPAKCHLPCLPQPPKPSTRPTSQ